MYAKVENGQVTYVPTSGILQDGRTVSNYHLLPDETLLAEGWLPCEEVKPTYDETTQYLSVDSTIEDNGKIIVTYKVMNFMAE